MAGKPTQLAQLNRLKASLAKVVHVDEFKDIRDKAEAIRGYAKTANLGLESQNLAAEVKIRAERGGGELIPKAITKGTKSHDVTLSDLGLSKMDSSRWQAIARIPEDDFERRIKAFELLGRASIPCHVVDSLTEAVPLMRAEIAENHCRKAFMPEEAVSVGGRLYRLIEKEAKKRQGTRTDLDKPSGKLPEGVTGDTRYIVARRRAHYRRARPASVTAPCWRA